MLRGYGVGAVDYLTKPINAEILRSKIAVFVDLFPQDPGARRAQRGPPARSDRARESAGGAAAARMRISSAACSERTAALDRAHQGVRENEERSADGARGRAHRGVGLASGVRAQMRWSTDPEILFGFPNGSLGPELRIARAIHPEDERRVSDAAAAALETAGSGPSTAR